MAYIYSNPADASSLPTNQNNAQIIGYSPQDGYFKRAAQSFTTLTNDQINGLSFGMEIDAGHTSVGLTFRIETNSSGKPSGTLVDANFSATHAGISNTTWAWQDVTFTNTTITSGALSWAVCKITTESGTDYPPYADTGTFTNGSAGDYATYTSQTGAWTAAAGPKVCYRVSGTAAPSTAKYFRSLLGVGI